MSAVDRPRVTVADLKHLLESGAEDPVLYLDFESDQLEVWAGAYVGHHRKVISKEDLIEGWGFPISDELLTEILPDLQEVVDRLQF